MAIAVMMNSWFDDTLVLYSTIPDDAMVTNPADVLLQEYVESADAERAELLLQTLISEHALPDIRKAVLRKLAFQDQSSDAEHVIAEAALDLAARLRSTRDADTPFAALTAAAARDTTSEYLRRNHPTRYRVETRVRYLHTTEKGLAMWETNGEWLCGLSTWQAQGAEAVPKAKLDKWRDLLQHVPRGRNAVHPADLAFTIFGRLGAPVPLDDLTGIVQEILGLTEAAPAREGATSEMDHFRRTELAGWMAKLWALIREMPLARRSTVLLGLRAADGQAAATLLQLTRVAGLPQLAEALEIPVTELAAIWNQLPLDDAAIGVRLGIAPQGAGALRLAACEELKAL
jgi:hypothetical protein